MLQNVNIYSTYFKVTISLVLAVMFVLNLTISGKYKKTADVKNYFRKEPADMKSEKTLKRKTYIENCPNNSYKMEELPSCPDMMKRRFPKALIAGVSKGGTTMLLSFLNVHPRIAARDGKLPSNRFTAFFTRKEKTDSWYRNLMPCSYSNQVTMERSPAYFNCQSCPEAISKFNSKMKLIFIFRDPTERAFSQYLMEKRNSKHENKTFEDAVLTANLTKVKVDSSYIFVSRYQEHIQRWLGKFSPDQMLFLDSQAFVSSPSDVLNSVEEFLGIEHFFTHDMFKPGKRGKNCLVIDEDDLICPPASKASFHPNMKDTTRRTLNAYFKRLNTDFFQLISKQFEWGN